MNMLRMNAIWYEVVAHGLRTLEHMKINFSVSEASGASSFKSVSHRIIAANAPQHIFFNLSQD